MSESIYERLDKFKHKEGSEPAKPYSDPFVKKTPERGSTGRVGSFGSGRVGAFSGGQRTTEVGSFGGDAKARESYLNTRAELKAAADAEQAQVMSPANQYVSMVTTMNDNPAVAALNYYINYLMQSKKQMEYEQFTAAETEAKKQEAAEQMQKWASEHDKDPLISLIAGEDKQGMLSPASIASVGTSMLSGADYLTNVVETAVTGNARPKGLPGLSETTQVLRGEASDEMSDTGKFLYNTGMSGIDSLVASVGGGGGAVLLGLGAASNTYNDIKERGGSEKQALIGGAVSGIFESLFENVSIGNFSALKEMPVDSLKTLFKNYAKSAGVNFTEEALTEVANIAYDYFAMGDLSNYELMARSLEEQYLAQGMSESEAKKKAEQDTQWAFLKQVGEAGLSGALMSLGFTTVGTAASEYKAYKTGQDYADNSAQYDLVQLALQGDKNSRYYKMAENIAAELDASEDATVGSREIGRLENMMAYEAAKAAEDAEKAEKRERLKTTVADVFKTAKAKTSAQTADTVQSMPTTEVEQVAAVQEANPDTHVVPTSVNLFMEAGDDSATAARKSEILARVTSGDTTLSNSQLRKLDLNSAATRAVLQSVTGQAVPQTNDTKTLLNYGRALVEQYAQANTEQATIQSEIEAIAAQAAEQATQQAPAPVEQAPAPVAQAETSQPVAATQAESETPVQLSDGRSVTKAEFVEQYKAANPGKSDAVAKKMYDDAVRGNAMGMAYPSAVLQKADSAAQRSAGTEKRHSVDAVTSEAENRSEGKPTKAQEWTVKHANHVLSKRAGGPKVELRNDLASNVKGYYDKATKTVYLNANKLTTQQELTYTLSHELVHSVSGEQRTQLVNDICAFYEKMHGAEATQTELDNLRETYINQEMRENGLSRTEAEAKVDIGYIKEELAADFMSEMMENTGGLNRLAKENSGWLQTLRSKAVNLMRDLKGKITGNTEARALYNEAEALVDRMDRALKNDQDTDATVSGTKSSLDRGITETSSSAEAKEDASSMPKTGDNNKRFSVEAEALISELNEADIDDYSTPSHEMQSRAWFLPEVVEIRNRKFTDTAGLPNRKALRDKAEKTLMNNGSWDGTGYSGDVKIGYHADIVIGLPGSGKSTVAANPLSQKNQARVIDSDMAKEMLPEFDEGKGSANVHNESSKIRDKVMDSTVERGENLVFVTTGDNYAHLKREAQRLYDAGYEIAVHYVDVTPKQALSRSLRRFITENGEPGRYVPLNTVIHSADDLRSNVRELAQTGLVEYFEVIDNRGSEPVHTTGTPDSIGKFEFNVSALTGGKKTIEGSWDEAPAEVKKEKPKVKTKGLTALEKKVSKIAKSKAFKNWFHDGNGELLDEETGLPRVFYHGTGTAGYTRFAQQRKSEPGFWFAKNAHTSDAPYYTGRRVGDTETQEFVPVSAKSWEEAEDFLNDYAPVLELGYSRETGNYTVEDSATGDILGEFEDSDTGLQKFNDTYQTMIESASAVKDYWASLDRDNPPNPGMYRVFLSMKKPLVVQCEGKSWNRLSPYMVEDKRVQKAIIEKDVRGLIGYSDPNRPVVVVATRDFTAVAQEFGYDGVIFKDVVDGRKEYVLYGNGSATLEDVYDIMEKYNNFGAPDADIALSFIEDSGEIPSKMSEEDKAVVQAFLSSDESSDATGEFTDLPDDDFVVFDSSQIKSLHNEGTFDPSNPDIRYSVDRETRYIPWEAQVDLLSGDSVNKVLRGSSTSNRDSVIYVMSEIPDLYAQMGLSDLPLITTQKHGQNMMRPRYDQQGNVLDNSAHDLTKDQMKRLPELIRDPVAVFAADPNSDSKGGINILTSEVDSQGYPIFISIKADQPNYTYDGIEGPAHFVNAFARPNYEAYLRHAYKNGSVMYQSSEKVNANSLFRALTNRHSQQYGVDFDTILRQKDPTVKPRDRRYSVDKEGNKTKTGGNTGNVNPDTGYERGSVADSFMRIWNTGDREAALNVLEQTVARLSEMEAEQAEKRRAEATTNAFRPAGRLTEDAIARNKRVIEELIAKYGKMEQTSAAQQEVSLPTQRDDKTKVRGFMQTAAAAEVTNEAVLNEFERAIVDGDAGATYVPIGDKGTLRRATEALEKEGFDALLRQWEGKFEAGEALGKDDIAKAEQLYVEACNNRDTVTAMKLAAQISVAGTQAGQAVQAMTLLKKMTPSGNLYYIQKAVDRLNKNQKGKHKDIVINEELAKQLLEAETQEEIQNALDAICQDLANQMPVTLMDKWNTWRYLAMLGNPRTHIRNLLGNAVFTPARVVKDMLGATMEKALPVEQRTKAYTVSRELRDFAKQDAETMKDTLRGGGKYNPADMIRDKRRIFRSSVLNAAEQFNSALLESEDWLFLKSAYSRALGSFLSARGADASAISGADSTREGRALLEEARAYAVKEAQKATYRDMSKLAGTINHLKRNTGPVGEVFLEGLVPFTKTPINIVKRGVEYSPVGLVKGMADMATKVRKGDMSAAEGLDELCAGLTGTAIIGIGALLTKLGLLVAGHGDDDEDNFEELQGIQEYSLRIGDSTFTVDWTAPVALPLFVGSEIYSVLSADADEDVDALDAVLDGLTTMFEPMLSLSMLDGLNKTLSANKYGEEDDALYNIMATVISSYASQGVPTLFGQVARTVDDSRRTSFTPKGAGKVESWLSRAFQTSVQGKIPVAAEGRMLYVDNWGRTDTESNIWTRALENFVSPGYINEIKTSAVDAELKRLAEATNDTSVFPDRAKKYFSVNNEDYAMSQEEYQAHLIERGQHSYQLVSNITNDELYVDMDDATRAQAVTMAYDYASSIAKLHTNAEYAPDKWMLKVYELEQNGGDVAEYLLLRAESKVSGNSLTEVALGNSSLTDNDVVNITVMETTMPEGFTDPYTSGHEYVLNSEQQKQYEKFYRDYLAEEYSYLIEDSAYQEASAAEKYKMLQSIKSEVGEMTRREMSDWLWERGIEPTPKN